jgi:hypothetical protein
MAKTSGRQVEIGIGIETTPGTPVAATDYFKWESFSFQSMADKVLLNSARGIRNKTSNSLTIKKYGKGSLEFVPTVDILPYVLGLTLGSRSSGTHSGESAVYDHTFSVQNANASMKTATLLVAQGAVQTERYANCVVDKLNLTIDKDFAKCKIDVLGAFPDTGSLSSSYTLDTLFSRNEMTATFGTSFSNALGTFASTTLTSDATAPADGATIVIGAVTYTAKTALTGVPYEVLIGGSASVFLDNLKSAINDSGTEGTAYGNGTQAHPQVIATTKTATTLLIKARISGTTPNSIATTQAGTSHCTWAGATVNSGTPGTGPNPTPLVNFSLDISNNVQFDDAFLSGANTPVAGGYIAGPLEIKGSYTLQFADTTELSKYQSNTNSALVVSLLGALLGTVPTPELIQLKLGKLILTKEPLEYKIDAVTYVKQEFEVQYDATDKEISAIVTNNYVGTNYQ